MANRLKEKIKNTWQSPNPTLAHMHNLSIERIPIDEKELDEAVFRIIAYRSISEKIFGRKRRLLDLPDMLNDSRLEVTSAELVDSLLRLWEAKKIRIVDHPDKSSNKVLEPLI